jgi:hypothetical protein
MKGYEEEAGMKTDSDNKKAEEGPARSQAMEELVKVKKEMMDFRREVQVLKPKEFDQLLGWSAVSPSKKASLAAANVYGGSNETQN